jgi:PIN domain nuclease of toxin-antitoxin system
MHHRDPFDRLLVAQAMVNRASLVSPDPLLRRYEADIFW